MSRDPNQKRYRKMYRQEFEIAAEALKGRGGVLEWSDHDYIAFTWKEPKVHIVFYPHRTSAGNHYIRVRDQNSKDKALATQLMDALDAAVPTFKTFARKGKA